MIIKELDEQQCINRLVCENITLNELIKDDIMYLNDLNSKCDDCGLCWFDENEIDWYLKEYLLEPIYIYL